MSTLTAALGDLGLIVTGEPATGRLVLVIGELDRLTDRGVITREGWQCRDANLGGRGGGDSSLCGLLNRAVRERVMQLLREW